MMRRFLYTLALVLALPYIALHLLLRGRRQPEYLQHIGERFGFYPSPTTPRSPGDGPVIWIHAVSVGETRAAQPLVSGLHARYPKHRILITHMTPTGRQTSRDLYGDSVLCVYLPYDFPFAVSRFLRRFRPELGVLMETEIWPNLVFICRRSGVPLILANARMSEKAMRRYARVAGLARETLVGLTAIVAQTQSDAVRLRALGAPQVEVVGNLKFDMLPPQEQLEAGATLRAALGTRPVFLAASTRDGEEALILDALALQPLGDALLVIVPRHPQRFDEVAGLIAARGLRVQRRSERVPIAADTQVMLGDSMGEMFMYYAACDVAFVGGSLLPLGGQNLIEACAVGKPVLVGPHTFNFGEATEQALATGAAIRVCDAAELLRTLVLLLGDHERRGAMRAAGMAFAQQHRGATRKTLEIISRALAAADGYSERLPE